MDSPTHGRAAGSISLLFHVSLLLLAGVITFRVVVPRVAIKDGGVTIIASFAEVEEPEHSHIHVHAPGIPQDHTHSTVFPQIHSHSHSHPHHHHHHDDSGHAKPHTHVHVDESPSAAQLSIATRLVREQPVEAPARVQATQLKRTEVRQRPVLPTPTVRMIAPDDGAVDELPVKLPANPAPPYPEEALRLRLEGRVVLSVLVGADGQVQDLDVHKSSGVPSLDQAAITTVRAWRFQPAVRGRRAVAHRIAIPVRFKIP